MDSSGNVLVADTYNHRVLLVTPARAIRTVAGTGTGGASPEGTPPLVAQLRGPRAVCADRTGNLYIVDTSNHRVLRLPPGGALQTAAGNGSKGSAGDDGAARLAQLNTPSACATDSAGNLFIADTANHAIRKVNPSGAISTVAGMGVAGASGDEGCGHRCPAGFAARRRGGRHGRHLHRRHRQPSHSPGDARWRDPQHRRHRRGGLRGRRRSCRRRVAERPAGAVPGRRRRPLFRRHRQQPDSPPGAGRGGACPGDPVVGHHRGQRDQPARGSGGAGRDRRHLRRGSRTGHAQ